jgi:excisionase family DNA binding protein
MLNWAEMAGKIEKKVELIGAAQAYSLLQPTATGTAAMHSRTKAQRQFWSPTELAEILGTHRTTVFRWVRSGNLPKPIYLTPDRPVFSKTEVEAWLAGRARMPIANRRKASSS